VLIALGFQRFKLKHDESLSNFAFNFNVRRYTEPAPDTHQRQRRATLRGKTVQVDPGLTALGLYQCMKLKYDKCIQVLLSSLTCATTPRPPLQRRRHA
jgi:hypothetical protein